MNYTKEYNENLQRLKDCISFKHIDRVPHISMVYTWKIFDSSYTGTLSSALSDLQALGDIQSEFHERYGFDSHMDLGTRNMLGPSNAMGSTHIKIDDEAGTINFFDHVLLEGDEYDEYGADTTAFCWKMFCRKYPDATKGQVVQAIIENLSCGEFSNFMLQKHVEEYKVPAMPTQNIAGMVHSPIERIQKYYRGIRGTSLDIRRNKKSLKGALEVVQREEMIPRFRTALESDCSMYVTDVMTALLAHATLNKKQWEELYWPYLKEYLDMALAVNKTMTIFIENEVLRFAEYFQDYPKGFLLFVAEQDDVRELRKALPNVCIAGGMPTSLLGNGTPEECVDYVKRLIDDMGDGFMLTQDKMISFKNDCRRENLQAVCDYVRDFRW